MDKKDLIIIGRAEEVDFPELQLANIPARIDTGARTSSIWASNISEKNGELSFVIFDTDSDLYDGVVRTAKQYSKRNIASSTGEVQERYIVKLLINLKGRKIRTSFSLANRSQQVYPVLIGRRTLRGKFVVDVKIGKPQTEKELQRTKKLKVHKNEEKSQ
jgi:hypothetical protein